MTTSVKPIGEGRGFDLCIRKNSRVLMEGFLPELEAQVHLDYSANWGWDLAIQLFGPSNMFREPLIR